MGNAQFNDLPTDNTRNDFKYVIQHPDTCLPLLGKSYPPLFISSLSSLLVLSTCCCLEIALTVPEELRIFVNNLCIYFTLHFHTLLIPTFSL